LETEPVDIQQFCLQTMCL